MATESSFAQKFFKQWEKTGKSEFLKQCTKHAQTSNIEALSKLIYDFLQNGMLGTLKRESVTVTLSDILAIHDEIPSIVLDVIHALDAETLSDAEAQRQVLLQIIKDLEKLIPEPLLKERLEIESLQEVGTLKNQNFHTKFIRIKTKLYYKQKKFNLLREESEGYAKLITEVNQDPTSDTFTSSKLLEATKSLIGCFNLDPNRVLDLILEAAELRPECIDVFAELLRSFTDVESVVCEILGFKFAHFHRNKEPTPRSLYALAALLIQRQLLNLDQLYTWLMPLDITIEKDFHAEMEVHKDAVKKLNSISLNKPKDKDEGDIEPPHEKYARNQKFGLCEALLSQGAWAVAKTIIQRLPSRYVLDQPPVAQALSSLVHAVIEPLYAKHGMLLSKDLRSSASKILNPSTLRPISTFMDLRQDAIPMLTALGPALHADSILMYKMIRICKAGLAQLSGADVKQPPSEDSFYYDVITLIDLVFLPSLSHMDCNCCIAEEIWSLLKIFPYHIRYCMYSRWKNDTPSDDAKILHKNTEALKKLKDLMKRVSKENVKPIGRLLGKLTHACPGVLCDYILLQIQTYDNLIGPVVDSLKFLTSLSYDVLGYCIIENLAKASTDRDRSKFDGFSAATWLQTISTFCGAAFKRCNIELTGLLQYVANQLKDKNCLDLLIVRDVVVKMAGIEAQEEMTNEQLSAMSGGDLLKGEAGYFSQVRNTKVSSQRLKEALIEQNLGVTLCLLMAQQRHCVIYRDAEKTHLKLVGKLYDQCQDTLVQFGTFLCSSLSVEEYVSRFPSVNSMLTDYHINADVAFFLARPTLNHAVNMKYDALMKADPKSKEMTKAVKLSKYCEAVAAVLTPLVDSVKPLHSPHVWEDITPQFLVTFWSLTMYDLSVPTESYVREINKLKALALAALDSKKLPGNKGKKEVERYNALVDKLNEEKKKQTEHVEKVMARLRLEKDSWFPLKQQKAAAKNESIMQFLQLCVFPRSIFTASDAIYCAKFIRTVHMLHTENFSTLLCFDRLLCDTTYTVTLCTENEANRYGRFLCAVLETVMRWHGSADVFNAECANTPGFVTRFRISNQDGGDMISFENYRHLCHKWHYKITRAMMICLESKDYTQVRNALMVLTKILPQYPVIPRLASIIEKRIEKVQVEEKTARPDLYTLATSYLGLLKLKAPNFIRESDFHQIVPTKKEKEKQAEKEREKEKEKEGVVIEDGGDKRAEKRERDAKDKAERREAKKVKESEASPVLVKEKEKERNEKDKDKDRSRESHRARERKEEKHAAKEEKIFREERYVKDKEERYSSKDEGRYGGGGGGGGGGYYADTPHYYEEPRDMSSLSNSSTHSADNLDPDRETKRRKLEGNSKSHRSLEWVEPAGSSTGDKEKKERSSRGKEKSTRKEKKSTRKRDRHPDDGSPNLSPKSRKDDDSGSKSHQNGNSDAVESSHRSKRSYTPRDKTPPVYERERERSHDKVVRDKQRTEPSKRR